MSKRSKKRNDERTMKSCVPKKLVRNLDYPENTEGSEIAASVRREANNLKENEREDLFKIGMRMIYGANGAKETVRSR